MMPKEKPLVSNQHGALVMAFVPFLYAICQAETFHFNAILLGIAWFFLYLFSYPFFLLFSHKPTTRNYHLFKKWAIIYFSLSLIFALPVLTSQPLLLYFAIPILPLGLIQYYFAKQRNERHLLNDIAGILIFGVIGMATAYLLTQKLYFSVLIHPALFFIATTFYIKSMLRERKNPLYMEWSIALHLGLSLIYLSLMMDGLFVVYLFALARAILIPTLNWKVKQIGLFEFFTTVVLFVGLISENNVIG